MFIQSNELKPVYSICRYLVVNGTLIVSALEQLTRQQQSNIDAHGIPSSRTTQISHLFCYKKRR